MSELSTLNGFVTDVKAEELDRFLYTIQQLVDYEILCEEYLYEKGDSEIEDLSSWEISVKLYRDQDGFYRSWREVPIKYLSNRQIQDFGDHTTVHLKMDYILSEI